MSLVNTVSPHRMTADERCAEIASLLSRLFIQPQVPSSSAPAIIDPALARSLDNAPSQSVHGRDTHPLPRS